MQDGQVYAALDILLEEIESVANIVHKAIEEAVQERDYATVLLNIQKAEKIKDFREKVRTLKNEWATLFPREVEREEAERAKGVRLTRGLRTPEKSFRRPILEALMELGGRASISEVLERVKEKMKNILNEYDYEPLPSTPETPRWRNTAQWTRNTLVREGYMKSDSPFGIWEISAKGEQWLRGEVQDPLTK